MTFFLNAIKNHFFPKSVEDTIKYLKNPNCQILAGGTDLSLNVNQNTVSLIDIQKLPLKFIKETNEGFAIGSLTTAYEIYTNQNLPQSLREAAFKVSDTPLLHAVTIGGNLAKLYPWCDLPPVLWALEAKIKVYENNGELKEFSSDDFFAYSKEQNVSNKNALITEIVVPKPEFNSFSQYQKFGLTEVDKGQVNLASFFQWSEDGTIIKVRLIISAITKTIQRLRGIEKLLQGKKLTEQVIQDCVRELDKEIVVVPHFKSSIEFRSEIAKTYLRRTLKACKEVQA